MVRRRAVPDTKSWHCEPSPCLTTLRACGNLPSFRVAFGATRTSLLSELSTWPRVTFHLSRSPCSYRNRRSSNRRDRTIPRTVATKRVLRMFSRLILHDRPDLISPRAIIFRIMREKCCSINLVVLIEWRKSSILNVRNT